MRQLIFKDIIKGSELNDTILFFFFLFVLLCVSMISWICLILSNYRYLGDRHCHSITKHRTQWQASEMLMHIWKYTYLFNVSKRLGKDKIFGGQYTLLLDNTIMSSDLDDIYSCCHYLNKKATKNSIKEKERRSTYHIILLNGHSIKLTSNHWSIYP